MQNKIKKVAIIAPAFLPIPAVNGGAIETLVELLIEENEREKQIDLTIISAYNSKAVKKSKEYKNTRILWYKPRKYIGKLRNRFCRHIYCPLLGVEFFDHTTAQIINILKKEKYDRIILENRIEIIGLLGSIFEKEKIICHLHNRPVSILPDCFDNCNKVLTVSEFIKNDIIKRSSTNKKKVEVFKNAIDSSVFYPNEKYRLKTRERLCIKDNEVAICYVGRIVKEKGVKELIMAVQKLPPNLMFKLVIVGSLGGSFADFADTISDFSRELLTISKTLGNKIHFTGYIDNNQLPKLINGMDIAVMPSKCFEAAPVSNIEFQGIKLPLITTNMGGIPEYVTPESAFIIENDSHIINNISTKLKRLIEDASLRNKMGRVALENSKLFTKEIYYKNFIKILR